MTKPVIQILKIIICIFIILGLTGCWNRRELNTLAIVMGVGFDKTEESEQIQVTAQIAKPSEMKSAKSNDGGGSSANAYWNIKNTGNEVFTTFRGFTHQSNRKLFFPHIEVLIFSRPIAEEGVQKYVDFFLRDHEARLGVWVLVAQDNANEILDVPPRLEKIPATNISQLVDAQRATSESTVVKLYQFANRLMSKTTAPIAPLIEISGQGKDQTLVVSGTAVFKQDKLVGQLNKRETRGLLWVIDEVKSGIIDVECKDGSGKVSLEIIRAKSKIKPEISNDKIRMKINIEEEGNIGSQSCLENMELPPEIEALEQEKAAVIESEILAALTKAKKLNADIFGFGELIHKKHPRQWKELENRWDEIFPDIEVEVKVDAKLRRAGRLSSTAVPAKE